MSGATESSPVVGGRGTVVLHLCFDKFPLSTPFGEVLGTIRLGPVCLLLLLDASLLLTLEGNISVPLAQHRVGHRGTLACSVFRIDPPNATLFDRNIINSQRHVHGKGLLAHIKVCHHVSFK